MEVLNEGCSLCLLVPAATVSCSSSAYRLCNCYYFFLSLTFLFFYPPYVIFQLASSLRSLLRLFVFTSSIFHIFFLVVDSSACVRSRLQFFTASAELLTKLCHNVENVVNVKRKIVLRKQVRNTRRKKENYIVAENVRKPQERERS